jgi:hypothetical protein
MLTGLYLRIAAAVALVAVLLFGWHELTHHYDKQGYDRAYEEVRAANAKESLRRMERQEDANRETTKTLAALAADRDRASTAAGKLRDRLASIERSAHPTPLAAGEAASDPIGVLADVLGRADDRAGKLAEYADAARTAGQACERAYDSLTPPSKP